MTVRCLSLDGSRRLDSASVKQKFLGQGCFSRVWVRDDGKRPSALNLLLKCIHKRICAFIFKSAPEMQNNY